MTNYIKNQPWKKAAGIFVLFLMALTTSVLAAEAGADSGGEKETMWTLIKKGRPIMIPLGIASIISQSPDSNTLQIIINCKIIF